MILKIHKILINKRKRTGLKHFNDFEAFIEYANNMDRNIKTLKNIIQIKNSKY